MYAKRHTVTLTTDASGDATGYTDVINGRIHSIQYVKTDFATGVDFAITGEITGLGVWTESDVNASKTVAPRMPTHDLVGVASLFAAAGEPVETPVVLSGERVKIVVAQGGNAKTGTFYVTVT